MHRRRKPAPVRCVLTVSDPKILTKAFIRRDLSRCFVARFYATYFLLWRDAYENEINNNGSAEMRNYPRH